MQTSGVTPSPEPIRSNLSPAPSPYEISQRIHGITQEADDFAKNSEAFAQAIENGEAIGNSDHKREMDDFTTNSGNMIYEIGTFLTDIQNYPTAYPSGLTDQLTNLYNSIRNLQDTANDQKREPQSSGYYLAHSNEWQAIRNAANSLQQSDTLWGT